LPSLSLLPFLMKKNEKRRHVDLFFFYPLSSLRDPLCIGRRRDLF
jgi:hypothetical protein